MSSNNESNIKSSNHTTRITDRVGRTSTRAHLMRKAQQCLDEHEKYVTKLGDAQGNDVFKYLLLLNWIDCQGYVTEVQFQAQKSFRWSAGSAVAGFSLLTLLVIASVASKMPQLHMESIELAWVSGISCVVTTFISGIFFYLYSRALKRLTEFHTQLRETQRIVASLFLSGLIEHNDQRDQQRKEIIRLLLSDLGQSNQIEARDAPEYGTRAFLSGIAAAASR